MPERRRRTVVERSPNARSNFERVFNTPGRV